MSKGRMNDKILKQLAEYVIDYDKVITSCANDPEKMSSFCTAQGEDLDDLYFNMVCVAYQAMGKRFTITLECKSQYEDALERIERYKKIKDKDEMYRVLVGAVAEYERR